MSEWGVDPIGGPWLAILLSVLLFALLAVGPAKQIPAQRRRILLALRAVTALVLVFTMWRPSAVTTETRKLPGSLLVMVDDSRSMQVADAVANDTRWNSVKATLAAARDQLAELAESWDLKFYRFGEAVQPAKFEAGDVELPAEPEGPQSAIGSALEDVLDREAQQRIVAVLLLSDGAQRAFAPRDVAPQTAVQRLVVDEIPLYTVTYGQPALGLQSDLRVDDLLVNDTVFAETPVTVQASLLADGFANQKVKAQLLWENATGELEVVDTREVQLGAQQRRVPLSFSHTPLQPGEFKVAVQIESPAGELVTSNNVQNTFVSVLKGGVNILYLVGATRIGGGPSIEPRFVRAALAAHADLNVQYDLINYRRQRLDLRPVLAEEKFDVFLLGDVDVIGLSNASWEAIATAVEQGAGLAMLGGFHSFGPGGFRSSALEQVLPIQMGRAERQNFGEPPRQDMHLAGPVRMVPSNLGGASHPILRLAPEGEPEFNWSELPPLDGANRFERSQIKAIAQVIAETGDANRRPLMVAGAWGEGRTLAFAGDSTWRWQLEGFGEAQRRFWRQLVLWLAKKDDTDAESVWVRLDARRYQRGSPVEFEVGATDENRELLTQAEFDVQVQLPDGSQVAVRPARRGEKWVGSFDDTALPGDYRVTVAASSEGALIGTAQARLNVPDRDMELDQPAAEPTLMASLANLTGDAGGMGLAPEEVPDLLKQLQSRTAEYEEEIREQQTLWDSWPVFGLLVGLLGSEWYLRKKWGLV